MTATHLDQEETAMNSLLDSRASNAGYETADDFLSDAAWDLRQALDDAGFNTFSFSNSDLVATLVDCGGDVDEALSGYLE